MTQDAALVVIDMQSVFRDPESQWCCPGYDMAAEQVDRLTAAFHGNVIWTKFVRDPNEEGAWKDYYDRWDRCRESEDSAVWDLTQRVAEGDLVISRPTFSKWDAELADVVRENDRIVVCGVATDCCVLSTVLGAVDAGKWVTVVTDACAGATELAHQQANDLMGMLSPMVTLATTDEVLSIVSA